MTGGADQFEALPGMFNPFQFVSDSRDDDSGAVFLVATSAGSGLPNGPICVEYG
jgi:hypothetical protein